MSGKIPQARWFAGRVIDRIEWYATTDGRGGRGCDSPVIYFAGGGSLRFDAIPTEDAGPIVFPVYGKQ